MEKRWLPGDVILMEEYLDRTPPPQLINVRPQVVVEDRLEYLAIASLPGGTWMTRDVPGRTAMSVQEQIALYLKEELNHEWYVRVNAAATLTLHPPGVSYSIRLFWDANWNLRNWYVNFEDAYKRTATGIAVNDHTLDIVVTPDFVWSWKDEPEFVALVEAGRISSEKAKMIRTEGDQAIARIEAREWPFNEPWPEWRPDPHWHVPRITDYWHPL
jgi:predicted RNA-binding protein associated with RNAse of E/G family